MKNSQKGFVVPLLIAIIALLVIGGGGYLIYKNKKAEAPAVVDTGTQTNTQTTPVNDTTTAKPIITSISPASGAVGTAVEIHGKNLNGFEGETYLDFFKENGENGSISVNSYEPTGGATTLKFSIPDKMCVVKGGPSDLPCPGFMTITPGVYRIYAKPWTENSNEIYFTVTQSETASGIIKSVYSKSGKNYINIDYVEFNPNWVPGGNGEQGYQNNNPLIRTFEISSNAKFIVGSPATEYITFSDFKKYFTSSDPYVPFTLQSGNPWDIVVTNGVVTQITEHYLP